MCQCYWCTNRSLPWMIPRFPYSAMFGDEFSPYDVYDCGRYFLRVVPSWG